MLKFLFANMKRKAYKEGFAKGLSHEQEERRKINESILDSKVGKLFICVSNEWENPVVGKLVRYETSSPNSNFIMSSFLPVIEDYVTNTTVTCGGIIIPYSEEMILLLVDQMTPYQRWGVLTKNDIRPVTDKPQYQDQYKPLLTGSEIIEKVKFKL